MLFIVDLDLYNNYIYQYVKIVIILLKVLYGSYVLNNIGIFDLIKSVIL